MTYAEKGKIIGKKVYIKLGRGLLVEVKVLDYRSAFGHDQWLVTPVKGKGSEWVRDFVEIGKAIAA